MQNNTQNKCPVCESLVPADSSRCPCCNTKIAKSEPYIPPQPQSQPQPQQHAGNVYPPQPNINQNYYNPPQPYPTPNPAPPPPYPPVTPAPKHTLRNVLIALLVAVVLIGGGATAYYYGVVEPERSEKIAQSDLEIEKERLRNRIENIIWVAQDESDSDYFLLIKFENGTIDYDTYYADSENSYDINTYNYEVIDGSHIKVNGIERKVTFDKNSAGNEYVSFDPPFIDITFGWYDLEKIAAND